MSDWTPEDRDREIHHIGTLTKGIAVAAVGGTVVLGAGIAWGDQQRINQAEARQAAEPTGGPTLQAPPTAPSATPSPTARPKAPSGKSKSGGS